MQTGRRGALPGTLTEDGYPSGSLVSYAVDDVGAPVLLVSDMAEHTVNARRDSRASLLVAAATPEQADPLSLSLTLVGRSSLLDEPGEARDIYLHVHPCGVLRRLHRLRVLAPRGGVLPVRRRLRTHELKGEI